jgi:transcriptional antiterminator Rof (Rho-off)
MMKRTYQPVACELYDRLTDLAVKKKQLEVMYTDGDEQQITARICIADIVTRNKEEFLITDAGQEIRLDLLLYCEETGA